MSKNNALAGRLVDTIVQYADRAGLELDATTTFEEVTRKHAALVAAVAEARQLDREEASNRMRELSFFCPGLVLNWMTERLNTGVQQLDQECDAALSNLNAVVTRLGVKAAAVPAALERDAVAWEQAATGVQGFRDRIHGVAELPGWSGGAAGGYRDASTVQGNATVELAGVAGAVSNALRAIAGLNRAIFQQCSQLLVSAKHNLSRRDGRELYARTASAIQAIDQAVRGLERAEQGSWVEGSRDKLADEIASTLSAPLILEPERWPTGGALAAVTPGQTNRVPGTSGEAVAVGVVA